MSCGIFAYIGSKDIETARIFDLLREMESLKEEVDESPLGGHGAGYVSLSEGLVPFYNKVGLIANRSPVESLFDFEELQDAQGFKFFIGHVRRASDEFSSPDELDELHAHPFVHSGKKFRIYGVHNGFLKNYKEISNRYGIQEYFTDSDVLTQYFLALLENKGNISSACEELFSGIEGNNTAVFLIEGKDDYHLVVLHTGKTRGLVIFENEHGEMLLCSRKGLLLKYFEDLLEDRNYFETVAVGPKEHQLFINWWRVDHTIPFKLSEY
ncbi:MAG: hypothetical protein ABIM32_02260 [candidate division WOR-3 bacterium]